MKKTADMNRTELIYEIARHASPIWYHSVLDWPTDQLRILLAYYRGESHELPTGVKIQRTKGVGDPEPKKFYDHTKCMQGIRIIPAPKKPVVRRWPTWAVFNDHEIDMKGSGELQLRSLWIRKGRRIVIKNVPDTAIIKVARNIHLYGTLEIKHRQPWPENRVMK